MVVLYHQLRPKNGTHKIKNAPKGVFIFLDDYFSFAWKIRPIVPGPQCAPITGPTG